MNDSTTAELSRKLAARTVEHAIANREGNFMPITVDVKPDLSRFVQATEAEVTQLCIDNLVEHPVAAIRLIFKNYTLLPR